MVGWAQGPAGSLKNNPFNGMGLLWWTHESGGKAVAVGKTPGQLLQGGTNLRKGGCAREVYREASSGKEEGCVPVGESCSFTAKRESRRNNRQEHKGQNRKNELLKNPERTPKPFA